MESTSIEYWEYVDRVRRMVLELPDEDRRQGARLSGRCRALDSAIKDLSGERAIASEGYREDVLEGLEDLRQEAEATFRTFREERGIPDVTAGVQ